MVVVVVVVVGLPVSVVLLHMYVCMYVGEHMRAAALCGQLARHSIY